jgi:hypothetical protein
MKVLLPRSAKISRQDRRFPPTANSNVYHSIRIVAEASVNHFRGSSHRHQTSYSTPPCEADSLIGGVLDTLSGVVMTVCYISFRYPADPARNGTDPTSGPIATLPFAAF